MGHIVILCLTCKEKQTFPQQLNHFHSHHQCARIPVSPHPNQHLLIFLFLKMLIAILVDMKWHLTVVLVCISIWLMLLIIFSCAGSKCTNAYLSSLLFLIILLLLCCKNSLYSWILDFYQKNDNFSLSVDCLFTFLLMSFDAQ